jgi:hypothetical protein
VRFFGHSGGTAGQQAFLGVVPECEAAFAIQLNGMTTSGSAAVLQEVAEDVLHAIAGVRAAKPPLLNQLGPLGRFTGQFGLAGFRFEVSEHNGGLTARAEVEGYADLPPQFFQLKSVAEGRFAAFAQDGAPMYDFIFLEPDARGIPQYLFQGYRLHRRLQMSESSL